jgi:hypothetical protein
MDARNPVGPILAAIEGGETRRNVLSACALLPVLALIDIDNPTRGTRAAREVRADLEAFFERVAPEDASRYLHAYSGWLGQRLALLDGAVDEIRVDGVRHSDPRRQPNELHRARRGGCLDVEPELVEPPPAGYG